MAQKPSIPKGTRDFSSEVVIKRQYIIETIKKVFHTYGFQPIETPSFENSSTLMGKYGEEGDRLIFKILNSGDYLKKANEADLVSKNSKSLTTQISEKALRYDLTVPFARYVVQHQNELTFPFKRYQIQPVWRADRPQKGRFREFYQCDADVIGSQSLWQEVDFIQLYDRVFTQLKLKGVKIQLNNRKILAGLAELIEAQDQLIDFTVALDKLDKIGEDGVIEEMLRKGISESAVEKVKPLFKLTGDNQNKLNQLEALLHQSTIGLEGIKELRFLIEQAESLGLDTAELQINLTLARGLNYYTGAIFEVSAPDGVKMGSIGGGGRYDDLTGIFGLKNMSGVGISFGLDRIYLVLEELDLFDKVSLNKPEIVFLNLGEAEAQMSQSIVAKLRKHGIAVELYPDAAKMKKQMQYADKKGINNVAIIGSNELEQGQVLHKNMKTGEQDLLAFDAFINLFINS